MSGAVQKRRKELRTELSLIEKQIFDLETTYLEETRDLGNVFSGWDAYVSAEKQKVKKVVSNDERLFSLSSVTSPASRKEEAKDKKLEKGGSAATKNKKSDAIDVKEEHDS